MIGLSHGLPGDRRCLFKSSIVAVHFNVFGACLQLMTPLKGVATVTDGNCCSIPLVLTHMLQTAWSEPGLVAWDAPPDLCRGWG